MKRLYSIIIVIYIPFVLLSSVLSDNYIITSVYGDSIETEDNTINTISYFDEIGRKTAFVYSSGSNHENGIIQQFFYDMRGNISEEWLPLPLINGNIINTFYGENEIPYKEYKYTDQIWINRLCSISQPGILWKSHNVLYDYLSNDTIGIYSCQIIKIDKEGNLTISGNYKTGTLKVKKIIDSENRLFLYFYDRQQRLILSRCVADNIIADTRYVYDIYGDLRYTISPEGMSLIGESGIVDNSVLSGYSNYYQYNNQHKLILKKIAGAGEVEYVYDKFGNVIFYRDAVLRKNNKWIVKKYDKFGRPILEGTANLSISRKDLQHLYIDSVFVETFVKNENIAESQLLYTNLSGPKSFIPHCAWYYDNYDFTFNKPLNHIFENDNEKGVSQKGLCTGSAQVSGSYIWFTKRKYDINGNLLYESIYDLYLNNCYFTKIYKYNFRNVLVQKLEIVEELCEGETTSKNCAVWHFNLDNFDRIQSVDLSVNNSSSKTILVNEYDEIGRLKSSHVGVDIDYEYDIQSNVTKILSPVFAQELFYAKNPFSNRIWYDGNLCASSESYRDEELIISNDFCYDYDSFGRLISTKSTNKQIAEISEFDLNANILSVRRCFNGNIIQDAVMTYDGNQITSVIDASTPLGLDYIPSLMPGVYERKYGVSGNLYYDETRGIKSIFYNRINLPEKIYFDNDNYITSEYLDDGTLLNRIFASRILRTIIRINSAGDTIISKRNSIQFENHKYRGNFECVNGKWKLYSGVGYYDLEKNMHYSYIKDNLGSIVAIVDENGELLEQVAYLPSGIPYKIFDKQSSNDRKHIGNIWIPFNGLFTYDNTARFHFPLIPSYDTIDPNADKYPSLSPYSHCAGNDKCIADYNGMDTVYISYNKGKFSIPRIDINNGNDVFAIDNGSESKYVTFSEAEYSNRVCMLNLEIGEQKEDLALGVYYISGQGEKGCGFYVVPGGEASNKVGSNSRILDGIYDITPSEDYCKWVMPRIVNGTSFDNRGVKIHYGFTKLNTKWTQGCFLISSNYMKDEKSDSYMFSKEESINAVKNFCYLLGADDNCFKSQVISSNNRLKARFSKGISHKLILKTF